MREGSGQEPKTNVEAREARRMARRERERHQKRERRTRVGVVRPCFYIMDTHVAKRVRPGASRSDEYSLGGERERERAERERVSVK